MKLLTKSTKMLRALAKDNPNATIFFKVYSSSLVPEGITDEPEFAESLKAMGFIGAPASILLPSAPSPSAHPPSAPPEATSEATDQAIKTFEELKKMDQKYTVARFKKDYKQLLGPEVCWELVELNAHKIDMAFACNENNSTV